MIINSGLYHFHFRQYDAEVGGWTTADPIGILGGVNLYQYVQNDPINHIDWIGLRIDNYGWFSSGMWASSTLASEVKSFQNCVENDTFYTFYMGVGNDTALPGIGTITGSVGISFSFSNDYLVDAYFSIGHGSPEKIQGLAADFGLSLEMGIMSGGRDGMYGNASKTTNNYNLISFSDMTTPSGYTGKELSIGMGTSTEIKDFLMGGVGSYEYETDTWSLETVFESDTVEDEVDPSAGTLSPEDLNWGGP